MRRDCERDARRERRRASKRSPYKTPNNPDEYQPKPPEQIDAKIDEIEAMQLRETTHALRGALLYLGEVQYGGIVTEDVSRTLRDAERLISRALDGVGWEYRMRKRQDKREREARKKRSRQ